MREARERLAAREHQRLEASVGIGRGRPGSGGGEDGEINGNGAATAKEVRLCCVGPATLSLVLCCVCLCCVLFGRRALDSARCVTAEVVGAQVVCWHACCLANEPHRDTGGGLRAACAAAVVPGRDAQEAAERGGSAGQGAFPSREILTGVRW